MSLIVSPTASASSSQPLAAVPAGAGLHHPSFKWLWAAIGVLGLSVVQAERAKNTATAATRVDRRTAGLQRMAASA